MDDAVCSNNHESNTGNAGLSRRQVLAGAGGTGLLAAVAPAVLRAPAAQAAAQAAARAARQAAPGGGTPEQLHLTWGSDPATSVVVSWATPGQAVAPRVLLDGPGAGRRVIPAQARGYTDGLNGETVWTYHAQIRGLRPDTSYSYAVTAANDAAAAPLRASVRTAPAGRPASP